MKRTFNNLAAAFLRWARKKLKASTVAVYEHYFRRFAEKHGARRVDKFRPIHLSGWASTWHSCQAIKRLFRWAAEEAGIIGISPVAKVKCPPKGYRRRILQPAQAVAFLRAAKRDLRTLLLGYRETIARPQELRLARWDDVRAERLGDNLEQALQAGRASIILYDFKDRARRIDTERPRVLILSPRACRLLLRLYRRRRGTNSPIFLTARKKPWTANALRCRFRRLRSRLGFAPDRRGENVVPYTWRHTGATAAAAAGIRDRLLADFLGHVETKTTGRYCHLATEHLRAAMGALWRARSDGRN